VNFAPRGVVEFAGEEEKESTKKEPNLWGPALNVPEG